MHIGSIGNLDHGVKLKFKGTTQATSSRGHCVDGAEGVEVSSGSLTVCAPNNADSEKQGNSSGETQGKCQKPDSVAIPEDFLCPISLEIMRDPVIVATGQVFYY